MGEVEDAASAYWGGAAGLVRVCWVGMLEGPGVAVYPGREFSVLASCAVVLGG